MPSHLSQLPDGARAEALDFLSRGVSIFEVRVMLADEWRVESSLADLAACAESLSSPPPRPVPPASPLSPLIPLLHQWLSELLLRRQSEPTLLRSLADLLYKLESLALLQQRHAAEQEKSHAAAQAAAEADGPRRFDRPLSPEEARRFFDGLDDLFGLPDPYQYPPPPVAPETVPPATDSAQPLPEFQP